MSLHQLDVNGPLCLCSFHDFRQMSAAQHLGLLSSDRSETLVLYTYSNSDTEYERNLHYFVEHGMAEGDGCDYIIVVQEVSVRCSLSSAHLLTCNAMIPAFGIDLCSEHDREVQVHGGECM